MKDKTNIRLLRFDWAIKKLLRNKANFGILEGFLSELLNENIKIRQILDGESNKASDNDKHNRVDILVENTKGELIIIEVQNSKEYDYFHRILFGTSKSITEHIDEGDAYAKIKKVISITIAYFDLGQGEDYLYHGINQFKGVHSGDILNLAHRQKNLYDKNKVHEIFPEYWLIKVDKFNDRIQNKLDEWIFFLKNGAIQDSFSAKGLLEAKKKLDKMNLTKEEQAAYEAYLKNLRDLASEQHTKMADAEDLINQGKEIGKKIGEEIGEKRGEDKKEVQAVLGLHKAEVAEIIIAKALNISLEKVQQILKQHNLK